MFGIGTAHALDSAPRIRHGPAQVEAIPGCPKCPANTRRQTAMWLSPAQFVRHRGSLWLDQQEAAAREKTLSARNPYGRFLACSQTVQMCCCGGVDPQQKWGRSVPVDPTRRLQLQHLSGLGEFSLTLMVLAPTIFFGTVVRTRAVARTRLVITAGVMMHVMVVAALRTNRVTMAMPSGMNIYHRLRRRWFGRSDPAAAPCG